MGRNARRLHEGISQGVLKMKVLVSDSLSKDGLAVLTSAPGLEVDNKPGLSEDEIAKIIGDYRPVIRIGSR